MQGAGTFRKLARSPCPPVSNPAIESAKSALSNQTNRLGALPIFERLTPLFHNYYMNYFYEMHARTKKIENYQSLSLRLSLIKYLFLY